MGVYECTVDRRPSTGDLPYRQSGDKLNIFQL